MRNQVTLLLAGVVMLAPALASGQSPEDGTVAEAAQVMREIMVIPGKAIPESLLQHANGLVIIPGMVKGGFVVGVKHGKGVVIARDEHGVWQPPTFVTATGGSVGWQAGLQSTDVILVIRNRRGVDGIMRGKFTIGADASVAAGPVGRQAAAGTDLHLKAEILSYSRSRGLFAGVAIDGALIQVDQRANAAYYRQPGQLPSSALQLMNVVAQYTGSGAPVVIQNADAPPQPVNADRETLRKQLVEASKRLQVELDDQWRTFLALPQDVYVDGKSPAPDVLETFVARYNTVATDKQYQALNTRPEFQEVHMLLVRYHNSLAVQSGEALKLPPPPPRK